MTTKLTHMLTEIKHLIWYFARKLMDCYPNRAKYCKPMENKKLRPYLRAYKLHEACSNETCSAIVLAEEIEVVKHSPFGHWYSHITVHQPMASLYKYFPGLLETMQHHSLDVLFRPKSTDLQHFYKGAKCMEVTFWQIPAVWEWPNTFQHMEYGVS